MTCYCLLLAGLAGLVQRLVSLIVSVMTHKPALRASLGDPERYGPPLRLREDAPRRRRHSSGAAASFKRKCRVRLDFALDLFRVSLRVC